MTSLFPIKEVFSWEILWFMVLELIKNINLYYQKSDCCKTPTCLTTPFIITWIWWLGTRVCCFMTNNHTRFSERILYRQCKAGTRSQCALLPWPMLTPSMSLFTMPATHGVVRLFTCRGFTFLIKTLFDILMDLQFGFLFDFSKLTPYFTRISTPAAITVKSPSSCGNRTEKTCKMMNPDTKITTVIFVLHNVIAHCLHRVLRYARHCCYPVPNFLPGFRQYYTSGVIKCSNHITQIHQIRVHVQS